MISAKRRSVAIVGGGPAGLMAAEVLSRFADLDVTIYDAMPSLGRKLLMAGRGGLNLTHSEPLEQFLERYGAAKAHLQPYVDAFDPNAVRAWCEELGQETFVGSSGRVFPKIMKASGLLRAWLRRLAAQGARVRTRHHWCGWGRDGQLRFESPEHGEVLVAADVTVLALGGASWPRLGSDGTWVDVLSDQGISIVPLRPANCGFLVDWSDHFRERHEGTPLKRIAISHGDSVANGELMISAAGIEGGAIYAIGAAVRDAIDGDGERTVAIDLKPDVEIDTLGRQLARPKDKQSLATFLRKTVRLQPVAIGLLNEIAHYDNVSLRDLPNEELAYRIKHVRVPLEGITPITKAISTAGGVSFDEMDHASAPFMLTKRPGVFVAGEMLDWEAPTGGYLLQACLATGAAAGLSAERWLRKSGS